MSKRADADANQPLPPPDRATIEALLAHSRARTEARFGTAAGRLPQPVIVVSRIAAFCMFGFYAYIALDRGARAIAALPVLAIIVAIVCFPEVAGRYTGRIGFLEAITAPSNAVLILIVAWLLLLMPIWMPLLARAMT